ncbi:hypothetical protein CR513_14033, partial [Mucuna pruriens]
MREVILSIGTSSKKGRQEIMDTEAFQGPMTRGRLKRLQKEVLWKMGLLKSLEETAPSPTIYSIWACNLTP